MDRNNVVLVDELDQPIGQMEKMEAHFKGALHRAFSIFIFNTKNEILLQQRAATKYHGAGLWTNACCSHPQWGEDVKSSALERLKFEMGMECELQEGFSFIYHTPVENGLIEHEFDYVFLGISDNNPVPNPTEVSDFKWVTASALKQEIAEHPSRFTYWFKTALPNVLANLKS